MIKNFKLFEARGYHIPYIRMDNCTFSFEIEMTKDSFEIKKEEFDLPKHFEFIAGRGYTIEKVDLRRMFDIDYNNFYSIEKEIRNLNFSLTKDNYYLVLFEELGLKERNKQASKFGIEDLVKDDYDAIEYFKNNDINKIDDIFDLDENIKLEFYLEIYGKYECYLPTRNEIKDDELYLKKFNEGSWWNIVVELNYHMTLSDYIEADDYVPFLLPKYKFMEMYDELYRFNYELFYLNVKRKKDYAIVLGNVIVDHADSEEEAENMLEENDYTEVGFKDGKRVDLFNKDAVILNVSKMKPEELSTYEYDYDSFDEDDWEEYLFNKYSVDGRGILDDFK